MNELHEAAQAVLDVWDNGYLDNPRPIYERLRKALAAQSVKDPPYKPANGKELPNDGVLVEVRLSNGSVVRAFRAQRAWAIPQYQFIEWRGIP